MKETFRYLFIFLTTFNAERAAKVYQMIYYPSLFKNEGEKKVIIEVKEGEVKKTITKNDELIESLKYLKSKKIKTARDKATISFLEGMSL